MKREVRRSLYWNIRLSLICFFYLNQHDWEFQRLEHIWCQTYTQICNNKYVYIRNCITCSYRPVVFCYHYQSPAYSSQQKKAFEFCREYTKIWSLNQINMHVVDRPLELDIDPLSKLFNPLTFLWQKNFDLGSMFQHLKKLTFYTPVA